MTAPRQSASSTTSRAAGVGCAVMLVGLLIVVVGLVIRSGEDEVSSTTQTWGKVGFALIIGGLLLAALAGVVVRWQTRRRFTGPFAEEFETIEADIPTARAIMTAWFGAALAQRYPTGVIASMRVPARGRDTSLLVNIPKLKLRRRSEQHIEPTMALAWLTIDSPLPRLLLTRDARGQSALVGVDIDVENEEFNRRFRIDSSLPGSQGPAYADFARYASALLHPRAVDCLLTLPRGRTFIITDRMLAVAGSSLIDRDEILQCADVLAEFADLIPRHVRARWAGSTDYRPREG